MDFKKILIIRLSSIGDIILATALLRAVRKKYPAASIHFAIKKEYAELLRFDPHIDKLVEIDFKKADTTLQEISREKYDWVINIQKSSRSRQIISVVKNAVVTSYAKQRFIRFLLIAFKWNFYRDITPVYKRYFEAVEAQHIYYDGEGTAIFYAAEQEKKIAGILSGFAVQAQQNLVTICPGASFTNKMWMEEGFVALAKKLQQAYQAVIVLAGGPADAELCERIGARLEGNVINLAGKLTLLESAALLRKSRLVISNDSGMLHLAQSQKAPVVGIFGPTVKEFGFFPIDEDSVVVETELGCRPCTKMGKNYCPKGHHRCMKDISVEMVYNGVARLWPVKGL